MKWLEVSVNTTHDAEEIIADYFTELGAAGVQINDPDEFRMLQEAAPELSGIDTKDKENSISDVEIKAYFPADKNNKVFINQGTGSKKSAWPLKDLEEKIRHRLKELAQYINTGTGYSGFREIHEEDWAENWKKYYRTIHLTERLVVNPSWIEYNAKPGEIVVLLDPGSAFGTGTHESTSLCAENMDKLVKPDMKVLDLGTGSGILAIIAARLGAGVEAVDIDPQAVTVAENNAAINQTDIYIHTGELTDVKGQEFDLIVVNIIADVIIAIMPEMTKKLTASGRLLASGIISHRAEDVISTALDSGLKLISRQDKNDWVAMIFQHKSAL